MADGSGIRTDAEPNLWGVKSLYSEQEDDSRQRQIFDLAETGRKLKGVLDQ